LSRIEIAIPMKIPSYNTWSHWHWAKKQEMKRQWEGYAWALITAAKNRTPISPPLSVRIVARFRDRRRRDIDNFSNCPALKGVQDAIVAAGLAPDDSTAFIVSRSLEIETGADRDEVLIVIEEAHDGA